jgi:hypothetical protein
MGERANRARRETEREIRATRLSPEEKAFLRENAGYEGSPLHKRNPGDFGLPRPTYPRPDKTLCDEAGVTSREAAQSLFHRAIETGLVSAAKAKRKFPKQMWVVDEQRRVFEAIYGGSRAGLYHGYPIRRNDPLFGEVLAAWEEAS